VRATPRRKSPRSKTKSSRGKVHAYRERLRAQGMRPLQVWVPDTRSPRFVAEARRQSRLVASSHRATEDQAFVDAISDIGFE
jgi:Antitoxin MazE-like